MCRGFRSHIGRGVLAREGLALPGGGRCLGQFVKGDVVVLNFSFSDLSQTKRRPALVLAALQVDDLILCQITSQAREDRYSVRLGTADFVSGGLSQSSRLGGSIDDDAGVCVKQSTGADQAFRPASRAPPLMGSLACVAPITDEVLELCVDDALFPTSPPATGPLQPIVLRHRAEHAFGVGEIVSSPRTLPPTRLPAQRMSRAQSRVAGRVLISGGGNSIRAEVVKTRREREIQELLTLPWQTKQPPRRGTIT